MVDGDGQALEALEGLESCMEGFGDPLEFNRLAAMQSTAAVLCCRSCRAKPTTKDLSRLDYHGTTTTRGRLSGPEPTSGLKTVVLVVERRRFVRQVAISASRCS